MDPKGKTSLPSNLTAAGPLGRRDFLKACAAGAVFAPAAVRANAHPPRGSVMLLGASTPPGGVYFRHAFDALREHYRGARHVLVIVDASYPDDRDRQAGRMSAVIKEVCGAETVALHRLGDREAAAAINDTDGCFVGGGETFLLLRSLYDRRLLAPLRARLRAGVPYAGSSAGANIAGTVIGTTNDFPVTDVPSRRALGVFPAVINPHHPLADDPGFAGRAGKIAGYLRVNPDETVLGVSEPGIVRATADGVRVVAGPAWIYRAASVTAAETGQEITELFV